MNNESQSPQQDNESSSAPRAPRNNEPQEASPDGRGCLAALAQVVSAAIGAAAVVISAIIGLEKADVIPERVTPVLADVLPILDSDEKPPEKRTPETGSTDTDTNGPEPTDPDPSTSKTPDTYPTTSETPDPYPTTSEPPDPNPTTSPDDDPPTSSEPPTTYPTENESTFGEEPQDPPPTDGLAQPQ